MIVHRQYNLDEPKVDEHNPDEHHIDGHQTHESSEWESYLPTDYDSAIFAFTPEPTVDEPTVEELNVQVKENLRPISQSTRDLSKTPEVQQPQRAIPWQQRLGSTVLHNKRASNPAIAPLFTLRPGDTLRTNPQGCIRDHILATNKQWVHTRDTIIAEPLLADWRMHELHFNNHIRKAAQIAHLRREIKTDKAPRALKPVLRAYDWFRTRRDEKKDQKFCDNLLARLNERYVKLQLVQRKAVAETLMESAEAEIHNGDSR